MGKFEALHDWAKGFLNDQNESWLMADFLSPGEGSTAVTPVSGEAYDKVYLGGTAWLKHNDFAFQVMFRLSSDTDNTNIENRNWVDNWQNWVGLQNETKNFPDFGAKCSDYSLSCLDDMPMLAWVDDNGMAKYQFFARVKYFEVK